MFKIRLILVFSFILTVGQCQIAVNATEVIFRVYMPGESVVTLPQYKPSTSTSNTTGVLKCIKLRY